MPTKKMSEPKPNDLSAPSPQLVEKVRARILLMDDKELRFSLTQLKGWHYNLALEEYRNRKARELEQGTKEFEALFGTAENPKHPLGAEEPQTV